VGRDHRPRRSHLHERQRQHHRRAGEDAGGEFRSPAVGQRSAEFQRLVLTEFIPEARELGAGLPNRGTPELVGGIVVGVAVMVPLAFVQV
jgi:hypothetical protein